MPSSLDPSYDKGFPLLPHSFGECGAGEETSGHTVILPRNALFDWFVHICLPKQDFGLWGWRPGLNQSSTYLSGLIPLFDTEQMLTAFLLRNLIFQSNILHPRLIFMRFFYLQGYSMVWLGGSQSQRKSIQRKCARSCYRQRIDAIMSSTAGVI